MLQYVIPLIATLRPLWGYVLNIVLALAILPALISAIAAAWEGGR